MIGQELARRLDGRHTVSEHGGELKRMSNKRFAPELTGHNIKVIKDSDEEKKMQKGEQKVRIKKVIELSETEQETVTKVMRLAERINKIIPEYSIHQILREMYEQGHFAINDDNVTGVTYVAPDEIEY